MLTMKNESCDPFELFVLSIYRFGVIESTIGKSEVFRHGKSISDESSVVDSHFNRIKLAISTRWQLNLHIDTRE